MSSKDVVEDFCSSLCDLTVNSKPHINMLTMLAEDYIEHAPAIVQAVEEQLKHVSGDVKLPVLYLIDSIIKNVGKSYITLFSKNIVTVFTHAFDLVDEKARSQMYKLKLTWQGIFPAGKLYALDTKVNAIDPAWPVLSAPPTSSIHVNPKFLNNPPSLPISNDKNQQELLKQKKELLELQKRKVELELMQTKAILEEQTKRVNSVPAPPPPEVKKIPPALTIITKPKPVSESKPKSSVAALVAPVRLRDPRLRHKEPKPSTDDPEVKSPPRAVLSPVPSPSNQQSTSETVKPPKRDKKTRRTKESRSRNKNDDTSPHKTKDKHDKSPKLTRAEEVLKNLEEEQRLSKITKLGSDTVINKAKQHDQKLHPKSTKDPVKPAPTKSKRSPPKPEPQSVEPQKERTPEAPPAMSALPPSPKTPSSPKSTEPTQPSSKSPVITPSDSSSSKEKSTPELEPKINLGVTLIRSESKTPSPPPIRKKSKKTRPPKRKREGTSPNLNDTKRKTPPPAQETSDLPEVLLDSGHDTDLRLLAPKTLDIESSPSKKSKDEILDDLFGKEDVDLRALPPPPPIISRPTPPRSPQSTRSPERQKSWANLKRSNSETSPDSSKRPYRPSHERRKSDRFIVHKEKEVVDEEPSFDDPAYEVRANERAEMIMRNAEEQLNNGNITFAQYNSLLKEVITTNEKRKLHEAMRRDFDAEVMDFGSEKSPSPERDPELEPPNVFNKRRKFNDNKPLDDTPPAPPPPDINERDFQHRSKDERRGRYTRDDERISRFDHNRAQNGPWNQARGTRNRDKFPGWNQQGRFDSNKPNFRFVPPVVNNVSGLVPQKQVPPADPAVLEMIAKDPMKTINIDGVPREIRFYGETAVIMMTWDDPRELNFQPGQRRVVFNDRESFVLQFNVPYIEVFVDGLPCQIRLGAPTREFFVEGMFYEGIFGGPPIQVRIGKRVHSVRLMGPLPNVRIGTESVKDLVAGKVTLFVDANNMVPIYLDAKPQRFDILGVPYILRFVEALQTVVINGVPFKIEFGGSLPVPMLFNGQRHYLRFSSLPKGIKPGYITIVNMEGGRLPSPPPLLPPPPPVMVNPDPTGLLPPPSLDIVPQTETSLRPPEMQNLGEPAQKPDQQPLELLANLMPAVFTPGIGQSYTVEDNSNHPPETSTAPLPTTGATTTSSITDFSLINVSELVKKLVAVGIVPATEKKEERREEVTTEIIPVSIDRPETLKTRQPGLVHSLYSGMQCSSCGVRFPPEQTGKYSQHLDWHFRQNRRERDAMRIAQSRRWNYDVSDWIQYQEIEEKEDRAQSWFEMIEKRNFEAEEPAEDEPSVPAGESGENACCEICQDKFDQFYNEEREEWHLRRAIEVDGKLYHPLCHKDREEKLMNPVDTSIPGVLDKSVLLVPTEEPETIEIPDDTVISDATVLGMPIDEDKVETIDLDSEQSSSKDGQVDEEVKKDEEDDGHESDDDILQIEVLENKIETFELSDEEGEKDGDPVNGIEENIPQDESEDNLEVDLSKVKSEKIEVVDLDAQTSQPLVVSSIDGNVELEDAAPVSLPKRIIINIPSAVTKPPNKPTSPPPVEELETLAVVTSQIVDSSEPPPPGEELYPQNVKPRLSEAELKILPSVNKGNELSALCSIM